MEKWRVYCFGIVQIYVRRSVYDACSFGMRVLGLTQLIVLGALAVTAQTPDGNVGINQANTMVRSYFDTGVNLMYAVGAVLGLVGAIKVYQKWSHGDHDTGKVAASWFGSCIFLVVVATLLRSFFGL